MSGEGKKEIDSLPTPVSGGVTTTTTSPTTPSVVLPTSTTTMPEQQQQQQQHWQLPVGIETHFENGIIKMGIGAVVGGVFGIMLFKSGKGYRTASSITGMGVGIGSTYARSTYIPSPTSVATSPYYYTTTTNSNHNTDTTK